MVRAYADEEVLCMLYEFNIGCSVEQPKSGGNYFRLRETRKFLSLLYKNATNMTKTRRLRIKKLDVIDVTSMKKCLFFPCCYWSISFFFLEVFSLRSNVVQKSAVLHMDGKNYTVTDRKTYASLSRMHFNVHKFELASIIELMLIYINCKTK